MLGYKILSMYAGLLGRIESIRDREEGQALVEYALIVALIAVVAISVLTSLGSAITSQLSKAASAIKNA